MSFINAFSNVIDIVPNTLGATIGIAKEVLTSPLKESIFEVGRSISQSVYGLERSVRTSVYSIPLLLNPSLDKEATVESQFPVYLGEFPNSWINCGIAHSFVLDQVRAARDYILDKTKANSTLYHLAFRVVPLATIITAPLIFIVDAPLAAVGLAFMAVACAIKHVYDFDARPLTEFTYGQLSCLHIASSLLLAVTLTISPTKAIVSTLENT